MKQNSVSQNSPNRTHRVTVFVVCLLGALITINISWSVVPAQAQTQAEMNQAACDEYKKTDTALNKAYQQLMTQKKADKVFVSKLREAQRNWIKFRDAHIESLYPGPRSQYGSVATLCECSAKAELTQQRNDHLKRMLKSTEGDVCY